MTFYRFESHADRSVLARVEADDYLGAWEKFARARGFADFDAFQAADRDEDDATMVDETEEALNAEAAARLPEEVRGIVRSALSLQAARQFDIGDELTRDVDAVAEHVVQGGRAVLRNPAEQQAGQSAIGILSLDESGRATRTDGDGFGGLLAVN